MFRRMYDAVVRAAGHPRAPWALAILSFAEASFFPIPPDVMLAPMVLAEPRRWWRFALIATAGSLAGGILGYAIGALFIDALLPWLHEFGYYPSYATVREWFSGYGFWAVLLAGFSPIPYKVFTIAAGAASMAFAPFVLASGVGRGARFVIVAALVRWAGPAFEQRLLQYIDWIGWAIVIAVAALIAYYRFA